MSDSEFFERNILVTGASSGIGECISRYFLNCGARVFMVCQDVESAKKTASGYKNAIILGVDLVLRDINIYDLIKTLKERNKNELKQEQKFDVVVNCAGVKLDGDIEKTFPQEFDYTLDLNLRVPFHIIKHMQKDNLLEDNASIINISCLYGTRPCCGMISHAMSKAGLETLTRYAAAELAPVKHIRVNAVTACPVMTNALRLVEVPEVEIQNYNKKMEKNIPMGRIAYPHDVAKVVAFLASSRSSKITGQIIKVDGGRSLTSSGYIHYKGCRNMNSRFEPDGYKVNEFVTEVSKKIMGQKNTVPFSGTTEQIKSSVESIMKRSNFSTKDSDAHQNPNSLYTKVDK